MNNFKIDLDNTVDEDFFGSLKGSKSSKLQQLFVEDGLSSEEKQQSLKYQRPKDIATSSHGTSTTLMAKVVMAYRQGELQGKVGLALIQNPDNCNIIMYKTKTHILTTLKLQPEKDLLYKHTKYWQFYDEKSTYWSFSFDTPTDEEEFIKKLYIKNITFKNSEENEYIAEKHLESPNFNNEPQKCNVENYRCRTSSNAPKETKNTLIKRMAKMGKPLPTLPFSSQQTTTEFSDSSDTEVIMTSLASTQKPSVALRSNTIANNQELVPSINGLNSVAGAVYPMNPLESQYMQMLLTEQRTQGSEIRMNICKLENKIEKVLDKLVIYDDRKDGKQKIEKDDEILELEEKLLMMKKENRRLKQKLLEKSSEESQENKIKDVLSEFKEDLNKFNIDCKQDLKNVLIELNGKLKVSHNELQEMQQKIEENEQKVKKLITELNLNVTKNVELKNEIISLNQRENDLKQHLNEKEIEVVKQKHEILDLQNKLQEKSQETLKTPNDALVKSIMNNLYLDIADKLNNSSLPHSEQILILTASSIKEQTLKSLQQSKPKDSLN